LFIGIRVKKGAGKDLLFEEGFIDFVFSQNSRPYQRMDSDLIDSSWKPFCPIEDGLNAIVGKQFSRCLSSFKVEVDLFFDQISTALTKGDRVEIRGLCSFFVKEYKSYQKRNPKTGEYVKVTPKKLPFFKIGKELKERVGYCLTDIFYDSKNYQRYIRTRRSRHFYLEI